LLEKEPIRHIIDITIPFLLEAGIVLEGGGLADNSRQTTAVSSFAFTL